MMRAPVFPPEGVQARARNQCQARPCRCGRERIKKDPAEGDAPDDLRVMKRRDNRRFPRAGESGGDEQDGEHDRRAVKPEIYCIFHAKGQDSVRCIQHKNLRYCNHQERIETVNRQWLPMAEFTQADNIGRAKRRAEERADDPFADMRKLRTCEDQDAAKPDACRGPSAPSNFFPQEHDSQRHGKERHDKDDAIKIRKRQRVQGSDHKIGRARDKNRAQHMQPHARRDKTFQAVTRCKPYPCNYHANAAADRKNLMDGIMFLKNF